MEYLRVRNFEKFQHYKQRRPPWIKLYFSILSDPNFYQLSDASKLHTIAIMLLASQHDNKIPFNKRWISSAIQANTRLNWDEIFSSGMILCERDASSALASCTQHAERETETETETEIPIVPFDELRSIACSYCGATEQQTGFSHENDHFIPVSAGGTDDPNNMVLACHRCNQAKQGRIFKSVQECREWLHKSYWQSNRQRWVDHRKYAFGGKPPTFDRNAADLGFDQFWKLYPRKIGKGAAIKSWKKIHANNGTIEQILSAIATQKLSHDWLKDDGQFIPYPATWLNQTRWLDEPFKGNEAQKPKTSVRFGKDADGNDVAYITQAKEN